MPFSSYQEQVGMNIQGAGIRSAEIAGMDAKNLSGLGEGISKFAQGMSALSRANDTLSKDKDEATGKEYAAQILDNLDTHIANYKELPNKDKNIPGSSLPRFLGEEAKKMLQEKGIDSEVAKNAVDSYMLSSRKEIMLAANKNTLQDINLKIEEISRLKAMEVARIIKDTPTEDIFNIEGRLEQAETLSSEQQLGLISMEALPQAAIDEIKKSDEEQFGSMWDSEPMYQQMASRDKFVEGGVKQKLLITADILVNSGEYNKALNLVEASGILKTQADIAAYRDELVKRNNVYLNGVSTRDNFAQQKESQMHKEEYLSDMITLDSINKDRDSTDAVTKESYLKNITDFQENLIRKGWSRTDVEKMTKRMDKLNMEHSETLASDFLLRITKGDTSDRLIDEIYSANRNTQELDYTHYVSLMSKIETEKRVAQSGQGALLSSVRRAMRGKFKAQESIIKLGGKNNIYLTRANDADTRVVELALQLKDAKKAYQIVSEQVDSEDSLYAGLTTIVTEDTGGSIAVELIAPSGTVDEKRRAIKKYSQNLTALNKLPNKLSKSEFSAMLMQINTMAEEVEKESKQSIKK